MAEQSATGPHAHLQPGLTSPARFGATITPDDGVAISPTPRGVWVGGAGTLVFKDHLGTTVTLTNVPDGTLLPIMPRSVEEATTCTALVALW